MSHRATHPQPIRNPLPTRFEPKTHQPRMRNLCPASMLEAVRAAAGTTIDIDLVNRVYISSHPKVARLSES